MNMKFKLKKKLKQSKIFKRNKNNKKKWKMKKPKIIFQDLILIQILIIDIFVNF